MCSTDQIAVCSLQLLIRASGAHKLLLCCLSFLPHNMQVQQTVCQVILVSCSSGMIYGVYIMGPMFHASLAVQQLLHYAGTHCDSKVDYAVGPGCPSAKPVHNPGSQGKQ